MRSNKDIPVLLQQQADMLLPQGYERFGFTQEAGCTVYREWAPLALSAALIGNFNDWQGTWMSRDQFGVWSVSLPDGILIFSMLLGSTPDPIWGVFEPQQRELHAGTDGAPAIQHGSRVKIRLQHPDGWFVDRIPAWIRWSTVEAGRMGARYDGIFWDPPKGVRHAWCET